MTEKPHVLVIGTGSIGERHTRCFLGTGRVEVSICEIDDSVREAVAGRYQLRGVHADFDAALVDQPDIAVICVPAHLHVAMAIRLLETGIHVLCEKPLSTSLENIDRLLELDASENTRFAMAYVHRAHPLHSATRDQLHSGDFGRPLEVIAQSGQHFPHYRPAYRETYYTDHATGGGAVQDGLTHMVNLVEWYVGPMTRVAADCDHLALEGVSVEDSVHVLARHDEVMVNYTMNQHQAPNETSLTIICERGTLKVEMHHNRWRSVTEPEQPWSDHEGPEMVRDTVFILQANAFLDYIAGVASPLCTLTEGLQTLRGNLAILAAAETAAWRDV